MGENTAPPQVRFYQNGYEVRRCGSGNIAVAAYLENTFGPSSSVLIKASSESITLNMHGSGLYGYSAQTLPQYPLRQASFWRNVLSCKCVHGAYAGGPRDYVVLEVEDEQSLCALKPSLKLLKQYSGRALIASAKAGGDCNYVLRYFAPQYGNNEDRATGSANIQLLRYWFNRGLHGKLKARQLSEGGGAFYGQFLKNGAQLWGRARIESAPDVRKYRAV
ncbi:Predicted epimerase, PhzC/PhzF homolog [Alteromonadaceae bacterium Bs31]|nr:Predicted epimerase, PhzC/PhzF homolog [Alteromonadaceae bacterium Bs31]